MSAPLQRIKELDNELTRVFADFQALAKTLDFQEICELSDEATIAEQRYPGIYKIEMYADTSHASFERWYEWFHEQWVTADYERMFVPNPRKKRVAAHRGKPLSPWVPIYLGKSRDVAGRVLGHIRLKLSQPTTALKLAERVNMAGQRFRLSTVRIEVVNYDLIVPQIEGALRNYYNPILGRQ